MLPRLIKDDLSEAGGDNLEAATWNHNSALERVYVAVGCFLLDGKPLQWSTNKSKADSMRDEQLFRK